MAETTPWASVIIVSYNGKRDLERCLASLVADARLADAHPEYEIIVVDNASTDGSAAFVAQAYPLVTLIRNPTNLGFGHGNNLGAARARGEYLAFLNPDTVVEPGWLDALITALRSAPDAGMATSQLRLLRQPGQINTCGNEVHITGLTLCRGMGMQTDTYAAPSEVTSVSGAAFAMRRELFERLGGFDERFFLYVEDTDLSLRCRLTGFRCLYVPDSVVYHDYELRFGPHKTYYQERNRYLMLLKSLRWPTLLALLPVLLLGEVVTWGFSLLRERSRLANKAHAYGWLWGFRCYISDSRRRTQLLRRVSDRTLLAGSVFRLAYEQTGEGPIARLAHWILDPLFIVGGRLALAVIRW